MTISFSFDGIPYFIEANDLLSGDEADGIATYVSQRCRELLKQAYSNTEGQGAKP